MADEAPDNAEKTEEPTAKRLIDARSRGQVPLSREIGTWASMGAALIVMVALVPDLAATMRDGLVGLIERAARTPLDSAGVGAVMGEMGWLLVKIVVLPMLIIGVVHAGAMLFQTQGLVSSAPMKPKLSKLSPLSGLKRLFSVHGLVEFARNVAKLGVVGGVIYLALRPMLASVEHFAGLPMERLLHEAHGLTVDLLMGVVLALAVIAVADLIYQRHKFFRDMRMTRREVKDEYKQTEGDPTIKGRLRNLRLQKARQRMMANVPKADVVITNPTHFAVALRYDGSRMQAPVVVAKGADILAFRIRELARENEVPIVENPPLARALYASVELDEEIPPEHYRAMAEVISYVFRLKRRPV